MRFERHIWVFAFSVSIGVHAASIAALGLFARSSSPLLHLPAGESDGIRVRLSPILTLEPEAAVLPSESSDELPDNVEIASVVAEVNDSDGTQQIADATAEMEKTVDADELEDEIPVESAIEPTSLTELAADHLDQLLDAARQRIDKANQIIEQVARRFAHLLESVPVSPSPTTPENSGSATPGVSRAPVALAINKPPQYPREALRRRQAGTVVLHLSVGQSGLVGEATVLKTSGVELLDASALNAAKSWRFEPAFDNGQPIGCEVDVPVTFVLR